MSAPTQAIIIGLGQAGLLSALTLTSLRKPIPCTIYELYTEPRTIGGAINLTPPALRILKRHLSPSLWSRLLSLGCSVKTLNFLSGHSGQAIGSIKFGDIDAWGYESLRIMRSGLQSVLLEAVLERGVKVEYGKKAVSVTAADIADWLEVSFEDGTTTKGDLLLGCDGINSMVRRSYVDPDARTEYTGIVNAFGTSPVSSLASNSGTLKKFDTTAMFKTRFGTLMMTYHAPEKDSVYWAAVVETSDAGSRDGWKLAGADSQKVRRDLVQRFSTDRCSAIGETAKRCFESSEEVCFYPVYALKYGGRWRKGRAVLLGDAAHAMPPQGQSAGIAMEDATLLGRVLDVMEDKRWDFERALARWEEIRRPRVETAVKWATKTFEGVKERGWVESWIMEWVDWIVLTVFGWMISRAFRYDINTVEL